MAHYVTLWASAESSPLLLVCIPDDLPFPGSLAFCSKVSPLYLPLKLEPEKHLLPQMAAHIDKIISDF